MSTDTLRTLVRKIGDVEVIVRLPLDMPDPRIDLSVHTTCTTGEQRSAAIEAFHLDEQHIKESNDFVWFERATADKWTDGQMTATVFVESPPMREAA